MNHKVTIDGTEYFPASEMSKDANATAKAIISAMAGGWYTSLNCHVEGGEPGLHCDCPACTLFRVVQEFLGDDFSENEQTDPAFLALYKSCSK